MTSRGQAETDKLKQNLEAQLDRLVQQLADLEECRDDIAPDEYAEVKEETLDQLRELNASLSKIISGDMTLVDELASFQLATQATISSAFRTPEVIRMFARREPAQLRERLAQVEAGMPGTASQKREILSALRQLGERLTPEELQFLAEATADVSALPFDRLQPEGAEDTDGGCERILEMAGSEVRSVAFT